MPACDGISMTRTERIAAPLLLPSRPVLRVTQGPRRRTPIQFHLLQSTNMASVSIFLTREAYRAHAPRVRVTWRRFCVLPTARRRKISRIYCLLAWWAGYPSRGV